MDQFEKLLQVPDHDLYAWVTGEAAVPEPYQTGLMRKLQQHHSQTESGH
jgi:antitoxin CptB